MGTKPQPRRPSLAGTLTLLRALGLSAQDQALALLRLGMEPLHAMAAGAELHPDSPGRYLWLRAWVSPELLDLTELPPWRWTRVMLQAGVHPLSLVFSSASLEEAAFYAHRIKVHLPEGLAAPSGLDASRITFCGRNRPLVLPEGIVAHGRQVVLRDWRLPMGFPRAFHAARGVVFANVRGLRDA